MSMGVRRPFLRTADPMSAPAPGGRVHSIGAVGGMNSHKCRRLNGAGVRQLSVQLRVR
jgi:hypothetical protein